MLISNRYGLYLLSNLQLHFQLQPHIPSVEIAVEYLLICNWVIKNLLITSWSDSHYSLLDTTKVIIILFLLFVVKYSSTSFLWANLSIIPIQWIHMYSSSSFQPMYGFNRYVLIIIIVTVINVAAGKAPMQISTEEGGTPQKALDGSSALVFTTETCTLTKCERVPWWYVNLLEPYMVQLVRLDFGKPCCGEFSHLPYQRT